MSQFEQGEIGPDLFRAACNFGLEGMVSRDRPYRPGRSPDWIKVKEPKSSRDRTGQGVVCMTDIDAFDLWWGWAVKPLDSSLTIPAEIHEAVMTLLPEERLDREKVNAAVRDGFALGPLRPAGTADQYGVPRATE